MSVLPPFFFLFSSSFLIVVSVLSPFLSLLVSVLVCHCVRLPSVSFCLASCLRSCLSLRPSCLPSCLPSCWSLCPSCLPSVSLCLRSCLPSAIVSILSPFSFLLSPFLLMFNKWTWECFVVVPPVWGLRWCNFNFSWAVIHVSP